MDQLVLNLFFLGAIAFVPNDAANPSQMTAYLLESSHVEPSHSKCSHTPILVVPLPLDADPKACGAGAACDPFSAGGPCCTTYKLPMEATPPQVHLCVCSLKNVDVAFNPLPEAKTRKVHRMRRSLPDGDGDQADNGWLLRISSFNPASSRIQTWDSIKKADPRRVAARAVFGWEEAQVCHADQNYPYFLHGRQQSRSPEFDINNFDFIRLDGGKGSSDHKQALAEMAQFKLLFPPHPVRIELRDLDRPEELTTLNIPCPGSACPDVLVANFLSDWGCTDYDVGTHFAHFYDLSRNKDPEKLVPHRRRDRMVVDQEFSCTPKPSGPLEEIRSALVLELRDRFQKCPESFSDAGRATLENFLQLFGRGSVDLFRELLSGRVKACLRDTPGKDRQKLRAFLFEQRRGVSTRIICPMAMFDP